MFMIFTCGRSDDPNNDLNWDGLNFRSFNTRKEAQVVLSQLLKVEPHYFKIIEVKINEDGDEDIWKLFEN